MTRRLLSALVAALLLMIPGSATARPGAAAPPRVLIMGTSTTACAGPTDPAACYVERVRTARPGVQVTVIGRAGTYLAFGPVEKNWTAHTIPSGFDVVVAQHGLNDWYVPVSAADWRAQVREYLTRVRTANPTARIVWVRTWMPSTSAADWPVRKAVWDAHGVTTRQVVRSFGGTWVDLDPTGAGGAPYRADATGWHYGNSGHSVIASALLPYIPKAGRR